MFFELSATRSSTSPATISILKESAEIPFAALTTCCKSCTVNSTFLLYEFAGSPVTSFLMGSWRFLQIMLLKLQGVHVFIYRRSQLFITCAILQGTQNSDYFHFDWIPHYFHTTTVVVFIWFYSRWSHSILIAPVNDITMPALVSIIIYTITPNTTKIWIIYNTVVYTTSRLIPTISKFNCILILTEWSDNCLWVA